MAFVKTVLLKIINVPNCPNCAVLPNDFKYYSFNSQSFTRGIATGLLKSHNIFIIRLSEGCHAFDSVSLGAHGAYSLAQLMEWEMYNNNEVARRLYLSPPKQCWRQNMMMNQPRHNIMELQNDGTFSFLGGLTEKDYIQHCISSLDDDDDNTYYYCPDFNGGVCSARLVYLNSAHEEKMKLYLMKYMDCPQKLVLYERSYDFAKQLCCPDDEEHFCGVFCRSLKKLLANVAYEEGFGYLFIRPFWGLSNTAAAANLMNNNDGNDDDESLKRFLLNKQITPISYYQAKLQSSFVDPKLLINVGICQDCFFQIEGDDDDNNNNDEDDDNDGSNIYTDLISVGYNNDKDCNFIGKRVSSANNDGLTFDYIIQLFLIPPSSPEQKKDPPFLLILEIFSANNENNERRSRRGERFMSRIHHSTRPVTFFF